MDAHVCIVWMEYVHYMHIYVSVVWWEEKNMHDTESMQSQNQTNPENKCHRKMLLIRSELLQACRGSALRPLREPGL